MTNFQLTRRFGLRDLVVCLHAQCSECYPVGIRGAVPCSTLADSAELRNYHLFEALGQPLIVITLALYGDQNIGLGLKGPAFAMDSMTNDLCLSLFPRVHYRQTKAPVKSHVMMDLHSLIPVFISITTRKIHDVRPLKAISQPAVYILVIDKGYHDFARLFTLHQQKINLVIPATNNLRFAWIASRPVDASLGFGAAQMILLATPKSKTSHPELCAEYRFVTRKKEGIWSSTTTCLACRR